MTRIPATFLLAVALAALPGCGGDDEESSAPKEQTETTTVVEKTEPGDSGTETTTEDAPPEESPEESPEEDGTAESEDSEDASPESEIVDVEVVNGLKLGTSLEAVLEELGTEPLRRRPGPGKTTCYTFRVRAGQEDSDQPRKILRAELCFQDGKLRGQSLVTTPPASG